MDTNTPQTAGSAGRYSVNCDECQEAMRYTDSMQESAAGGYCSKCRAEIAASIARAAARTARRSAKAGAR